MVRQTSPGAGTYAGPAYLIAGLMIAYSAIDYLGAVWPFVPSDVGWRYGSAGTLTGFALTPLLGMLIILVVATATGQRRVLRVAAMVSLGLAAAYVLILLGFGLDALQLRREAPAESRRLFDQGVVKAIAKHLGATAAWGWLGLRGSRTVGRLKRAPSEAGDLVVR